MYDTEMVCGDARHDSIRSTALFDTSFAFLLSSFAAYYRWGRHTGVIGSMFTVNDKSFYSILLPVNCADCH